MAEAYEIVLREASELYTTQGGKPLYNRFQHRGLGRNRPFEMQLPHCFLPCSNDAVVCFLHWQFEELLDPNSANPEEVAWKIKLCRCGVVLRGIFIQSVPSCGPSGGDGYSQGDVVVKTLNSSQLALQNDAVKDEVDALRALHEPGFSSHLRSEFFVRWSYTVDTSNSYVLMDRVANGSLAMYCYKRLGQLCVFGNKHCDAFGENAKREFLQRAWRRDALSMCCQVLAGVSVMHEKRVCHLDLDPSNIMIHSDLRARIVDFGSAKRMDSRGRVGVDDPRPIKSKTNYEAPEVFNHNHAYTEQGLLGAPADVWSCGVLLFQLLCYSLPNGNVALNDRCSGQVPLDRKWWLVKLRRHLQNAVSTPCAEPCSVCSFPAHFSPAVIEILCGILCADAPEHRPTAANVLDVLQVELANAPSDLAVIAADVNAMFSAAGALASSGAVVDG